MLKLLEDIKMLPHIKYREIIQCRGHKIPFQSKNNNILYYRWRKTILSKIII